MNRAQLKERGKAAFKANYWVCVLVALLLSIAVGGFGGSVSGSASSQLSGTETTYSDTNQDWEDLADLADLDIDDDPIAVMNNAEGMTREEKVTVVKEAAPTIVTASALGLLISVFLLGPLEVGCRNFFLKNLDEKQEFSVIKTGFTGNYARNAVAMFLVTLFECLWALLLIIPGLVMSYAYAMVPYLIAEDKDLGAMDAIKKSKALMKGHKWDLFVLDISFIGWIILEVITLGLVGLFYSNPYIFSTHAAFYDALKKGQLEA